jgi:palmitoyltransferase
MANSLVRTNGFETPRHPLQVSSWVLFVVLVGGFYALQVPFLPTVLAIIAGIVYGITAVCVGYFTYHCTAVDPKDPILNNECDGALAATEGRVYCNLCRDDVQKKSKHCRICNKCVEVFDHHCHWLNTCVGSRNYRYFLGILASTCTLTILQLACCAYLIIDYYAINSSATEKYSGWARGVDYFGCEVDNAKCIRFIAVQIAFAALLLPVVGLISQLGLFHVTLVRQQMTTYDFIVMQVKKEREREQLGIDDSFFGKFKQCMECNTAPQCVKTKAPKGRGRGRGRGQGGARKMWKGGGGKTAPNTDETVLAVDTSSPKANLDKGASKAVTPESTPEPSLEDAEEGRIVHTSSDASVSHSAPPPDAADQIRRSSNSGETQLESQEPDNGLV